MTLIRILAALLTAGVATLASAQATPAAPAASAPAKDCVKSKRHDHNADKAAATRAKSADCEDAGTPKKKPHDHQQVHK